ncbi:hypothetical protein BKA62DRAFT_699162, partial [Auriculariales sp. MPI-PUGE-AT-0066]
MDRAPTSAGVRFSSHWQEVLQTAAAPHLAHASMFFLVATERDHDSLALTTRLFRAYPRLRYLEFRLSRSSDVLWTPNLEILPSLIYLSPSTTLRLLDLRQVDDITALAVLRITKSIEVLELCELVLFQSGAQLPVASSWLDLPYLRRLSISSPPQICDHVFTSVVESTLRTLTSIQLHISHSEIIDLLAADGVQNRIIHLDITAERSDESDRLYLDVEREEDTTRMIQLLNACPRLAHLEIDGFDRRDIPRMLTAVHAPLVSLSIRHHNTQIGTEHETLLSLFKHEHQAVQALRVVSLDLAQIADTQDELVKTLCRRRIAARTSDDNSLLALLYKCNLGGRMVRYAET